MKRIRNYAVLPENVFEMIKNLNDKGVDRDTICELCNVSNEEYIEAYNKGYVSGYSNATEKAIKIIQDLSDQVFEVSKNE